MSPQSERDFFKAIFSLKELCHSIIFEAEMASQPSKKVSARARQADLLSSPTEQCGLCACGLTAHTYMECPRLSPAIRQSEASALAVDFRWHEKDSKLGSQEWVTARPGNDAEGIFYPMS